MNNTNSTWTTEVVSDDNASAYSPKQVNTLQLIVVTGSIISIMASAVTVIYFWGNRNVNQHDNVKNVNKDKKINIFRQMVVAVAISDSLRSFGNLFLDHPHSDGYICQIQAFFKTFGGLLSFSFVSIIAIVTFEEYSRQACKNIHMCKFYSYMQMPTCK